ncbi:MAG: arsenate reductase ArsC [Candidatus Thermoplasmatota archaeon]|nr:arsenate reductase ArsC [Candidatus Thermoplasmatota archaeon]
MEKQTVLFICTHNSARSQIAESILRKLGGECYEALSAGTDPTQVHSLSLQVLREKGYGTEGLRSKMAEEFLDREIDIVVTVCDNAKDACPFFPGAKRYVHRSFTDPSGKVGDGQVRLNKFRKVRDEIEAWIRSEFLT